MRDRLQQWYHSSVLFEIKGRLRSHFKPRMPRSCRTYIVNTETHDVQSDIVMETYWVEPPVGPGPGASIDLCGDEVMRFDCFGSDLGHYHFNVRQSKFLPSGETTRIYFPKGTIHDHIQHAAFEFRKNLDYGRGMNLDGRVRAVTIDQDAIDRAAETMKQRMLESLARSPPSLEAQLPISSIRHKFVRS